MKDFLRDVLDQVWTLLGMFIAWLVLDGSAKTVVGYAIVFSMVVWWATYPIRNARDDEQLLLDFLVQMPLEQTLTHARDIMET